jgi:hypothetical protein
MRIRRGGIDSSALKVEKIVSRRFRHCSASPVVRAFSLHGEFHPDTAQGVGFLSRQTLRQRGLFRCNVHITGVD